MRKLKVIGSIICLCLILTASIGVYAKQVDNSSIPNVPPANSTVKGVIYNGYIQGTNVNIRADNGASLGQVNNGDTLTYDAYISFKYFKDITNLPFRYVTMTSGQNKGLSGWVIANHVITKP